MKLSKTKQFFIVIAAFLILGISFKVMVLVEGLTEVRPVNAIPPVAGLVCGPVGAFACGIGNLLADMAGTFSNTSVLGVIGNFMAAYLPYRLWYLFSDERPNLHSNRNILRYCAISLVAAMTVSWILSFGMYVFWGVWIEEIYTYVFLNNFGFSIGLGLPILIILTSDSVRIECSRPMKQYLLLKSKFLKKSAYTVYLCLMVLLSSAVFFLHLSPDQAGWMLPVSAVALAALLCQLL